MRRLARALAYPLVCTLALSSCGGEQGGGTDTGEIVIGEYGSLTGAKPGRVLKGPVRPLRQSTNGR